jgi:hypothetical protein
VLLAFAQAQPEEAHSIEKNLMSRQTVGRKFEHLVHEGVPAADLPEEEESELEASEETYGIDQCSDVRMGQCSRRSSSQLPPAATAGSFRNPPSPRVMP